MWLLPWLVAPAPAAKVLGTTEWDTTRLLPHSERVAAVARGVVDGGIPVPFRDDCSGFVSAIYTGSGIPMDGRVATLWEAAGPTLHFEPIPHVGDLVFFDDSWDRDGNGAFDDELTHIAVVLDVADDGTVWMAHKGSERAIIRMNLLSPSDPEHNSRLRTDDGGPDELTLTGELFAGFAAVDPTRDWTVP